MVGRTSSPSLKREGGCGRKHPPTRVSSEGGAVVGRISPPSLETREEGWAWLLVHAKHRDEGRFPPHHVGIYPNDATRRISFLVASVVSVDNGKKPDHSLRSLSVLTICSLHWLQSGPVTVFFRFRNRTSNTSDIDCDAIV